MDFYLFIFFFFFKGKFVIFVPQQMKFITLFLIRKLKHRNQLQQCAFELLFLHLSN